MQNRIETTGTAHPVTRPAWAVALIVAQLEIDKSDGMTDYFNVDTGRTAALAWSRHTRDDFREMRKAAARFAETQHLGPGCDVWTPHVVLADDVPNSNGAAYWKGGQSHWHNELTDVENGQPRTFTAEAEARAFIASKGPDEPHPIYFGDQLVRFAWDLRRHSIEHRDKYSMGAGYYLKASGHYSSGWAVRKWAVDGYYLSDTARADGIDWSILAAVEAQPAGIAATRDQARASGILVSLNRERGGVEIRFPSKPAAPVLDSLKARGWRWSRFAGCWYHRNTAENRATAEAIAAGQDLSDQGHAPDLDRVLGF